MYGTRQVSRMKTLQDILELFPMEEGWIEVIKEKQTPIQVRVIKAVK